MNLIELNFGDDHRSRLLEGLAASIREKGLIGTQISDIVAHARTSRRTFYECFEDKDSCFLELAERLRESSMDLIEAAIDPDAPWDRQVEQAVDAYVGMLAADPKMAIAFSSELPTLGARWLEIRTAGIERFAELVVRLSGTPAMREGGVEQLSIEKAVMIVSGIDGMVVRAVHNDESIVDLAAPAKEIVKAAFGGRPARRERGAIGASSASGHPAVPVRGAGAENDA